MKTPSFTRAGALPSDLTRAEPRGAHEGGPAHRAAGPGNSQRSPPTLQKSPPLPADRGFLAAGHDHSEARPPADRWRRRADLDVLLASCAFLRRPGNCVVVSGGASLLRCASTHAALSLSTHDEDACRATVAGVPVRASEPPGASRSGREFELTAGCAERLMGSWAACFFAPHMLTFSEKQNRTK